MMTTIEMENVQLRKIEKIKKKTPFSFSHQCSTERKRNSDQSRDERLWSFSSPGRNSRELLDYPHGNIGTKKKRTNENKNERVHARKLKFVTYIDRILLDGDHQVDD